MAKITGTQDIPSELHEDYIKTLSLAQEDGRTGKRYPFRIPFMQTNDGRPSGKQLKQRTRFIESKDKFNTVNDETRERWYSAMPPWGSFLWYYNYFILSALTGNANIKSGGAGVIKSIQFKTISMPGSTGEGQVAIDAVDPAKTVVMLYGNSLIMYEFEAAAAAITVYPYVSSLAAELVKCKWSITSWGGEPTEAADIGLIIIEYI